MSYQNFIKQDHFPLIVVKNEEALNVMAKAAWNWNRHSPSSHYFSVSVLDGPGTGHQFFISARFDPRDTDKDDVNRAINDLCDWLRKVCESAGFEEIKE